MRVLLVAHPAHPMVARLAPTLATLVTQGCVIEAHLPLSPELNREGIPHTGLDEVALDLALRTLSSGDLLIAPPAGAAALAALAHVIGRGGDTPLVLVSADDAGDLIGSIAMARSGGPVSAGFRERLIQSAAFALGMAVAPVARGDEEFPERQLLPLERVRAFQHGENPHQRAAAYRYATRTGAGVLGAQLVQGAEPTLNDLLDIDAGARLVADLPVPSAALIRHTDPIGVATAETLLGAFKRAVETDHAAASGAIVALNSPIDRAVAVEIANGSYEAVVAPSVQDESAASALAARQELRVLLYQPEHPDIPELIGLGDALLMQTADHGAIQRSELRVVTERRPTLEELTDALFAWRVVRHVRSNAIVVARHATTLGIGAAQVNRRVAVETALQRAGDRARGAVMASDAYFPFAEGIAAAAAAGVTAVVQPGGSRRDSAAIEIANRNGMAMVFTGRRHYRR